VRLVLPWPSCHQGKGTRQQQLHTSLPPWDTTVSAMDSCYTLHVVQFKTPMDGMYCWWC
jgi:hypothetical protein